MKKVFLLAVISIIFSVASQAQIRVGGFLGFGSEVEQAGIGINGEFVLSEKVAISPNLLFYFPKKNGNIKTSFWELNGNLNYYFLNSEPVSVYGIAGLNVTSIKVKYDDNAFFDNDYSDSEVGLNLGIGANFTVGNVLPFSELKYTVSDFDQLVFILGVKFPIRD
jgi:outer membrane immunogenic protein